MRAWRQLREEKVGRTDFAIGFAIGVFIANLPLYGLQTVLSLYSARRLHLHPLSVIAGSHVSTPPIGPVLIAAAISVGHLLLHGALPAARDYDVIRRGLSETVAPLLLEWAIGGVIIGIALAAVAFAGTLVVFRAAFAGDSPGAARLRGEAE
jgi:uncharacterized protein (DUF2062 family)